VHSTAFKVALCYNPTTFPGNDLPTEYAQCKNSQRANVRAKPHSHCHSTSRVLVTLLLHAASTKPPASGVQGLETSVLGDTSSSPHTNPLAVQSNYARQPL
jgi:hypothetical protein